MGRCSRAFTDVGIHSKKLLVLGGAEHSGVWKGVIGLALMCCLPSHRSV